MVRRIINEEKVLLRDLPAATITAKKCIIGWCHSSGNIFLVRLPGLETEMCQHLSFFMCRRLDALSRLIFSKKRLKKEV
jgi:hypothetical protein